MAPNPSFIDLLFLRPQLQRVLGWTLRTRDCRTVGGSAPCARVSCGCSCAGHTRKELRPSRRPELRAGPARDRPGIGGGFGQWMVGGWPQIPTVQRGWQAAGRPSEAMGSVPRGGAWTRVHPWPENSAGQKGDQSCLSQQCRLGSEFSPLAPGHRVCLPGDKM